MKIIENKFGVVYERRVYLYQQNKAIMTTQMVNTVIERVNEMKSNVEIQKIMMQFSSSDEAYNWLVKAAIATLIGVQNSK